MFFCAEISCVLKFPPDSRLKRSCDNKMSKVKELHSKIGKVLEVLQFFHHAWRGKWI